MRVGIVSASLGAIPGSESARTGQLLAGPAGQNTGNLAFRHAVSRHVASPSVHVPWDSDPGWVRDRCDVLVIPSSNQANPSADFSLRAEFLDAVDLPCMALGLGAQSPSLGAEIAFRPGTLRYLRALSERSALIGVRGEYTSEVLDRIGVRNTIVIGCPAHFINPCPSLGMEIERKLRRRDFRRIVVTAGDLNPEHQELERTLFGWLMQRDGWYICQSHPDLVALARNRLEEIEGTPLREIREYLWPNAADEEFLRGARERFRVFFDARAWLEALRGVDLAVGPRFHGNLLAIQAGVPGICICHDSRTHELCRTLALPHLDERRFAEASGPEDLSCLAAFDGAAFDRRRAELVGRYRSLVVRSGVCVSRELDLLAGAERCLTH